MHTQDGGHHERAVAALARRAYVEAGDEYTRAARRVLADPHADVGPFDADERGRVGDGLRHAVTAAVAYRVAGRDDAARRRSEEGAAVALDLRRGLDRPVQHACLREFVGDLRVAGGLDGDDSAYDAAADAYRDADIDDARRWATTTLFRAAVAPTKQVARGLADGEVAVSWENLHGGGPAAPGAALASRTTYKRRRFPEFVERAVTDGHLAAPRGTTEYDTDHHRCPACGSTDVNWVADRTLCLRCSRPTERQ